MTVRPATEDVLHSNQALRTWAAGLRNWSRTARDTSSAERRRSHDLRDLATMTRGATAATAPERHAVEHAVPELGGAAMPGMGDVHVSELLAALVDRHGFGAIHAVQALSSALLCAGYPAESAEVSAADALQIVDWALQQPH